jgi:hypothetical protein
VPLKGKISFLSPQSDIETRGAIRIGIISGPLVA